VVERRWGDVLVFGRVVCQDPSSGKISIRVLETEDIESSAKEQLNITDEDDARM
jgi:hypothetical protein